MSKQFDSSMTAPKDSQRLKWHIRGMHCGSCAAKVEKSLRALAGVRRVRVIFATERLLVELAADVDAAMITDAVKTMGYKLEQHDLANKKESLWQRYGTFIMLVMLTALSTIAQLIDPSYGKIGFTITTLIGVIPFSQKAITQMKNGTWFCIETLMTVAAIGALLLGETVESTLVLFLFSVGEMLEGFAGRKAKAGIHKLMTLAPDSAIRIDNGQRTTVATEFLSPNDIIEVRPGDRLPVDGTVHSAQGVFNESALIGESMPVTRIQGEQVMAGFLVVDQPVQIIVVSEPGQNAIDRIITLIEEAESRRAPIARMIDRFSAWYTPLVMGIVALVLVIPPLVWGESWQDWAYKALTLLLIACPCALVVSIPAAVTSALTAATRFGALIKGGAALEKLRLINKLAFDKTGTLTEGKPTVTNITAFVGTESELLMLAAAVEQGSSHPLAKAVVSAAEAQQLVLPEASDITVLIGQGMTGTVAAQRIDILAPHYVTDMAAEQQQQLATLESQGNTVVVVLRAQQPVGLIALADTLRPDAVSAIKQLRAIGVECVMLTGDNRRAAAAIAKQLTIEFKAELLPEDKVAAITELQQANHDAVAMVGDGINDAPALKAAELGIAMGRGSDVALETADAALTHERLTELASMISLSKETARITRQNIAIALGVNTLFLLTTVFGLTGLMAAVLSDAGGTVLVTLNALRLMRRR